MRSDVAANLENVVHRHEADVVSVDLFDTLVYRKCIDPLVVFREQYKAIKDLIPNFANADDWVKVRKDLEGGLARRAFPSEIHLDDIYRAIAQHIGLDDDVMQALKSAELDAESQAIAPYRAMIAVLKRLQASGKIIILTTDTYLPRAFIKSTIDKFIDFPCTILCSSETLAPKHSGLAFVKLRELYPREVIVHFGDNPLSDVKRVSQGIYSCLVTHPRRAWLLRNNSYVQYLAELGIETFSSPLDEEISTEIETCRAEIAWRWAAVLTDFLVEADRYATFIQADEVWFLSRDCEIIFDALKASRTLFGKTQVKYVFASRAATRPIVATVDPQKYRSWTGQEPDDAVMETGRCLIEAYRAIKSRSSKSVLIIDSGWKGRVQVALQAALSDTMVRGFYFSTDHTCESQTERASGRFVEWNPGMINQAGVEALAGFAGPSCSGYRRDECGHWRPTFESIDSDVCPAEYGRYLKRYLTEFLGRVHLNGNSTSPVGRIAAIRNMLVFPDTVAARAFKGWSISHEVGGDSRGDLVSGCGAGYSARILGRQSDGNLWPELAFWSVSARNSVVKFLQRIRSIRRSRFGKRSSTLSLS